MTREINRLSRVQSHQLLCWIEQNYAELKANDVSYTAAAERCTKELNLGFVIGDTVLSRSAKEIEKDWRPSSRLGNPQGIKSHLLETQTRLDVLESQVASLLTESTLLLSELEVFQKQKTALEAELATLRGAIGFVADSSNVKLPVHYGIVQNSKPSLGIAKTQ